MLVYFTCESLAIISHTHNPNLIWVMGEDGQMRSKWLWKLMPLDSAELAWIAQTLAWLGVHPSTPVLCDQGRECVFVCPD